MAKRSFEAHTYVPTATADGTALTSATYQNIEAGGPLQYIEVSEIYIGGQATASAVNIMQFARTQSNATTPTALTNATAVDGPLKSFTSPTTTAPVTCIAASTGPSRASTNTHARLNLSLNAFGGIVRWVAAPGEEWGILSSTAGNGSVLSAFTGGSVGTIGSHLVYEIF